MADKYCSPECNRCYFEISLPWPEGHWWDKWGKDPTIFDTHFCPSCGVRLNPDGTVTRMVSEAVALAAPCNGVVKCGTCDLYDHCAVKDGTCGECAAVRLRAAQAQAQVERAETKGAGDDERAS